MEGSRAPARALPVQVTEHRLHEQDLPPEHRRGVGHRLSGRDQPGVDGAVRPVQHLRVVLAAAADLPQPGGSAERGRRGHVSAQARGVQEEGRGLRAAVRHGGGPARPGTDRELRQRVQHVRFQRGRSPGHGVITTASLDTNLLLLKQMGGRKENEGRVVYR